MPGRTIENGYGKSHRSIRADLAARMDAGEQFNCWRCGRLIGPGARWDLGHDDADRSIYRGPEHTYCNRSRGGRRSNGARRPAGKPRICEICGSEYHPSSHRQRTCGRACGVELRRRNSPPKLPKPKRTYARICSECAAPFETTFGHKLTCSETCSERREANAYKRRTYSPRVSGWQKLLERNRAV